MLDSLSLDVLKKKKKMRKFIICVLYGLSWASHMVLMVKRLPANAGDFRDADVPWVGNIAGGGHARRLPMDRAAWWAIVHRVVKSQT